MIIIKQLQYSVVLLISLLVSPTFAQPANLVLENMTISGTEFYEATNSITFGSNVTVANTGDVTLDAPLITIKDMVYVIEGGKLVILSETSAVNVDLQESNSPNIFRLKQNYPNPFNPITTINYFIPEKSIVTLSIFDILGNVVATLVNEEKPVGEYEVEFDALNFPSGVYFYRLQAGDFIQTKKMILLR